MSNRNKRKINECQVCGCQMSGFYKGDICSAACRQKKARMKRDAGKMLLRVQRDIEHLNQAVDLGLVDLYDSYELYHDIADKLNKLGQTIRERQPS